MTDKRLLTPEEIINALKEANKNYKPSREHYLVLNSDIELKALLKAQRAETLKEVDELHIISLVHDYEYYINEVGQQEKKHLPNCERCKFEALKGKLEG